MDNTKRDFETRKDEIENYFSFLEIIDDDKTLLKYTKDNIDVEEKISNKLQTMFVANAFLILYNLIESTVRNSILDIYEKIKEEEVTYEKLSEDLKLIWLKKQVASLKEAGFKHETLLTTIKMTAKEILDKEIVCLNKDDIPISGNVDAKQIRELAKGLGFNESADGRNLENIKDRRNGLAHGNHTFYDVGKGYSVNVLTAYKEETFDYLFDVISNIEKFIAEEKYKAQDAA